MSEVEPIVERPQASSPSRAEQDYLKAIHRLGGSEARVSPMKIADHLGVRAPSVTGMFKRLSEAGWLDYDSGVGAKLSAEGLMKARQVIRRHRLMELFLTRVLGLDWSEVDAEAEALEHVVSDRLEQKIAEYLGNPIEDPHGHPIPSVEGKMIQRQGLQPLSCFSAGKTVIVREASDDNSERLRHWQKHGLVPGATLEILSYDRLDDVFRLKIGEVVVPMGSAGLAGLYGEETTLQTEPRVEGRKPRRRAA